MIDENDQEELTDPVTPEENEAATEFTEEAASDEPIAAQADEITAAEEALAEAGEEVDPAWKETLQRIGIGEVDLLRVSTRDVMYLLKRMQFLQIVESTGVKEPLPEPEFLEAQSGWTIHHYGDAMCTSPGRLIFGGGNFRISTGDDDDDDGGEGGGILNPGKGTIIKQAFDSACELIRLAKEFGWGGALIVDGHPDMQRAAWIEAVRIGVRLEGYEADLKAEKKRRRIVSPSVERMREVIRMLASSGR